MHNINRRQAGKYGEKHRELLANLEFRAKALLEGGDPHYKDSVRFILLEYNPGMDALFGEKFPDLLSGNFHNRNSEHLLEAFLNKAPDLLLFPSFEPVGFSYFLDTRAVPHQLIGIYNRGIEEEDFEKPFADGFYMKPSEFSWHDMGHVEFMSFRDVEYIQHANKPIERIVWEWDVTRERIRKIQKQVAKKDDELGMAMKIVLSELLHERGFQYSLTVLKAELETPVWVRAIFRKKASGFYPDASEAVFARLDEAREKLLFVVRRLRDKDQMMWLKTLRADRVPVLVTHTPAVGFSSGNLVSIEIRPDSNVVNVAGAAGVKTTAVRDVLKVQMNPAKDSPLTNEMVSRIETVLAFSAQNAIQSVVITRDKNVLVRYANGDAVPLAAIVLPNFTPENARRLGKLEIFQMNQVLSVLETGGVLELVTRKPVQKYAGFVRAEENILSGLHEVTIKTLDGRTIVAPLVEVRIDPLAAEDLK